MIEFPVSGVETYWWLPSLVAFFISLLTASSGVSGAFVILPFQVSVLGFTSPAVSPTNLLFNIIAIPSGVYRYVHERRMLWPMAIIIIVGTLPGLIAGVFVRVSLLPDPGAFKFFAGFVLLYLGGRLIYDLLSGRKTREKARNLGRPFEVKTLQFNFRILRFEFNGEVYSISSLSLFLISLIVGLVGGIYGVGGGAFIAPILVSIYRIPVYAIAGSTLAGTFATSVIGVIFYALIAPFYSDSGLAVSPDWLLGLLFGIGGGLGMYVGARAQKYMPAKLIKSILALCVVFVAGKYILEFIT